MWVWTRVLQRRTADLLQYPPLDPTDSQSYAPQMSVQEVEDAEAAAALMEADAIAESERAAAAMQMNEWGGLAQGGVMPAAGVLGGRGGMAGGVPVAAGGDPDAALAAALMAADIDEMERREHALNSVQLGSAGGGGGIGGTGIGMGSMWGRGRAPATPPATPPTAAGAPATGGATSGGANALERMGNNMANWFKRGGANGGTNGGVNGGVDGGATPLSTLQTPASGSALSCAASAADNKTLHGLAAGGGGEAVPLSRDGDGIADGSTPPLFSAAAISSILNNLQPHSTPPPPTAAAIATTHPSHVPTALVAQPISPESSHHLPLAAIEPIPTDMSPPTLAAVELVDDDDDDDDLPMAQAIPEDDDDVDALPLVLAVADGPPSPPPPYAAAQSMPARAGVLAGYSDAQYMPPPTRPTEGMADGAMATRTAQQPLALPTSASAPPPQPSIEAFKQPSIAAFDPFPSAHPTPAAPRPTPAVAEAGPPSSINHPSISHAPPSVPSAPRVSIPDLVAMGFDFVHVQRALEQARGDINLAQEMLIEGTVAPPPPAPPAPAATPAPPHAPPATVPRPAAAMVARPAAAASAASPAQPAGLLIADVD